MNNKFTTITCLVVAAGAIQLENKLDALQCCGAPCAPSCAEPCDCEDKEEEPEEIELIPADLIEPEVEDTEEPVPEEAEPVEPEQEEPEPTGPEEEKPKVEVYDTTVDEMDPGTSLADILREADGRPLILDFQYDSCPPCQEIAPEFEKLMEDHPNAIFRKVDVMEHRELLTELGVSSLPTFKVWVNGELSNTVLGADLVSLEDAIDEAVETYETTQAEAEAEILIQAETRTTSDVVQLAQTFFGGLRLP